MRYLDWDVASSGPRTPSLPSFRQDSADTLTESLVDGHDGGGGRDGMKWEKRSHVEIGEGWLDVESVSRDPYIGTSVKNAVYSLGYDESGMRLFVAGGPLQLNARGSYAGIW
jgi:hypothetical protein